MRLFTAIDLPEAMKTKLSEICFGLPRTRWADPEQFHLTLVFLGEINPALIDEVSERLESIEFSPFEVTCQGIGSFRSGTLWLGVDASPQLLQLEQQIRNRLRGLDGLKLEAQRYRPHITLGKMDPQAPPLLDSFLSLNNADRYSFTADKFQLKTSQLNPKGAIHRLLMEFQADKNIKDANQNSDNPAPSVSIREQLRRGNLS